MVSSAQSANLDTISYILATLTAGGGIMGYARTKSLPSIIAGSAVGILCKLSGRPIRFSPFITERTN